MGIFSWFSSSEPTDYATVLAQLASEIAEAKQNLSEIRLRQRRFRLAVNAYGVGMWAIFLGLWYLNQLPWGLFGIDPYGTEARVVGAGGVVLAPFLIWAVNRAISWIFARKRTSEETHLRLLLSKQRKQVEEIKKITNFDTTRRLIEQYDDSPMGTPQRPPPGTPQRGSPSTPQRSQQAQQPQQPQSQPQVPNTPKQASPQGQQANTPYAPGHLPPATPVPVPIPQGFTPEQAAVLQMQMQAITPVLPTPEKKWYDRLADTILGDDPAQAAQHKYALVCSECFRHNGLVGSKAEWERMQWICPRCNHLNKSPLSRMAAEEVEPSNGGGEPKVNLQHPETPSKPAKQRTHVASPTASPLRRAVGERSARSSRLGQEVFSASDADEDEFDKDGGKSEEPMDLDK